MGRERSAGLRGFGAVRDSGGGEQRVDELLGREVAQVVDALARRRRSAPGSPNSSARPTITPPLAVPSSLVSTSPVTGATSVNSARLGERVLAGVRVEHEQRLVRRARAARADHARDLAELLHQRLLRLEAAGGVDDRDVGAARERGLHGVEGDRRRIAARRCPRSPRSRCARPRSGAARSPPRGRCRPRRAPRWRPSA